MQSFAARHFMNCFHEDGDAENFMSHEVAEFIIMITRNVEDFGSCSRESHELRHNLHVQVAKSRFRLHPREVDDVADKVDAVGVDFSEEI